LPFIGGTHSNLKKKKMNKIKTKYNSLSKNQKIIYLSISIVLTILVINQFYNAGEVIGSTYYNLTN
jgi:flagellar biosynthesis/type III secretory pathway M-ring protein FliF/YscJ